jgi:hypothetical protein
MIHSARHLPPAFGLLVRPLLASRDGIARGPLQPHQSDYNDGGSNPAPQDDRRASMTSHRPTSMRHESPAGPTTTADDGRGRRAAVVGIRLRHGRVGA